MIRWLIWNIGTWFFVAVLWRTGWWRELMPLAVLCAAFLWIVVGGLLLAHGGTRRAPGRAQPADNAVAFEREIQRRVQNIRDNEAAK